MVSLHLSGQDALTPGQQPLQNFLPKGDSSLISHSSCMQSLNFLCPYCLQHVGGKVLLRCRDIPVSFSASKHKQIPDGSMVLDPASRLFTSAWSFRNFWHSFSCRASAPPFIVLIYSCAYTAKLLSLLQSSLHKHPQICCILSYVDCLCIWRWSGLMEDVQVGWCQ